MVDADQIATRGQLLETLQQMTRPSDGSAAEPFGLLLIKLSHFRKFNTLHGYRAADQLLAQFISGLNSIRRPQDYLARVGNADFVLVLQGVSQEGFASLAAIKIHENMKSPLIVDGDQIQVQTHCGIVLYPEHANEVEALLQKAESALDFARRKSQPYTIYQEQQQQDSILDWDIQHDLSHAIERDQFELFFQPQIGLQSGQLFGAEALIRWHNGDKGYIRPDLFIPIAEKSGQIIEITAWTLNSALWFIKEWGRRHNPIRVAVNISTRMLSEPDFYELVCNSIALYGVEYEYLTLEITESAIVEDMSSSTEILESLKQLGINISIDDFGTGYSSMSYFKGLPANELKIDRTFIQFMLENPMDQHIVKTIIHLAQGFDLKVVAEGIEDEASFDLLRQLNCDLAQGYYIARPMPREDFIVWANEGFEKLRG